MPSYYNPESRPLTMDEMTVNANFILSYLMGKGWTKNAVCGLLGNIQTESSMNPARWQGDNVGDTADGFGLTQWTPATKYLDWASANGYTYTSMEGNLERIIYEVANNLQWFGGVSGSMTFEEWTHSTDTPYNLAMDFIATYEHPADPSQPARGEQADYWYTHLDGSGVIIDPTPTPTTGTTDETIHLLLSDTLNGWKF
jgi:hypothetical protein